MSLQVESQDIEHETRGIEDEIQELERRLEAAKARRTPSVPASKYPTSGTGTNNGEKVPISLKLYLLTTPSTPLPPTPSFPPPPLRFRSPPRLICFQQRPRILPRAHQTQIFIPGFSNLFPLFLCIYHSPFRARCASKPKASDGSR